jgi:hypothetical protein
MHDEERFWERVGAIRPSQLLYTYGPGALIDLPGMSVMTTGLDSWRTENAGTIVEDRLLTAVRAQLGPQVRDLKLPPWKPETRSVFDDWARTGITVVPFPRWLRCTVCDQLGTIDGGLFKPKTYPYRPDLAQYIHENCPKSRSPLAIAARFVLACAAGHMDDFPWVEYAHRGHPCSGPILKLYETGRGSGLGDVVVKCISCEAGGVSLRAVFGENASNRLPRCRGRHPHLRRFDEACDAQVRVILLGASNAWFAMPLSVLSIPTSTEELPQRVEKYWPVLEKAKSKEVLEYMLEEKPEVGGLRGVAIDELWAAVEARKQVNTPLPAGPVDLLEPEWRVLCSPASAPRSDDFRIQAAAAPPSFSTTVSSVVLADRLREVVAITGFTRLDGPLSGADGKVANRAPLARKAPTWIPATEVRGEGIFVRFYDPAIEAWEDRVAGSERDEMHQRAHSACLGARGLNGGTTWPGLRYLLLHTLSHMLIREIALECGYAAASIRERIYARPSGPAMAGILLYTAAPDAEGTLGGLVSLGQPEMLDRILRQAIDHARLCSSDPLCAETRPGDHNRVLHAAACHACCFVSETSCERGNRYLDRALVVETVSPLGLAFFS